MKFLFQLQLLFSIFLLTFSSCQKDPNPSPSPSPNTNCNYVSYSIGSTFKFVQSSQLNNAPPSVDTLIETVIGDTILMGKNHKIVHTHFAIDTQTINLLYICDNNEYKVGSYNSTGGFNGIIYLKEGLSIGDSWGDTSFIIPATPFENEFTYQGTNSRTVNGLVFNDVIHIKKREYTHYNNTRTLTSTLNFYYAKGVGLVERDILFANGSLFYSLKIHSYDIK